MHTFSFCNIAWKLFAGDNAEMWWGRESKKTVHQTQSNILYVLNNAQLMHSFPFRNPEAWSHFIIAFYLSDGPNEKH